jgi:potassium-dependent mechanosensitive channel
MSKKLKTIIYFKQLFTLILFLLSVNNFSQVNPLPDKGKNDLTIDDSTISIAKLVGKDSITTKLERAEEKLINESIIRNKEKQIKTLRENLFNSIRNEVNSINEYLKNGIDTSEINESLNIAESRYLIASEGIFINNIYPQTSRNLRTSEILMKELLKQLEIKRKQVNIYLKDLGVFRSKLDSFTNDTLLFKLPKDTAAFKEYVLSLLKLAAYMSPADSNLNTAISNLNSIDNNINLLSGRISNSIKSINDSRSLLEGINFKRELPDIWKPFDNYRSYKDASDFSFSKNTLVLYSFTRNNLVLIILIFIFYLLLHLYLNKIIRKLAGFGELYAANKNEQFIKKPFVTSFFIAIILFQFLFPRPPLIFLGILWIIAGIMLTFLFWKNIKRGLLFAWLCIFILFLFALQSDMLLQVSFFERWYLLIIAATGLFVGVYAIRRDYGKFKFKNMLRPILLISIILFAVSFVANIFGRFNFAKLQITTGILMIITGIMLFSATILIEKIVFISTELYTDSANDRHKLKLKKLGVSLPRLFKVFLVAGWIVIVARNFYFYDYLASEFFNFLGTERMIGKYNFSFENILIFIAILYLSILVSKIISFYADSQSTTTAGTAGAVISEGTTKSALGNWLLLIRIAVVSAGILLAFAAAGIQMDKLTIIIGSLGVGIGFGLQSIVGNFISGILLAFERPIHIGDQIEVEGKLGIIKEIGIRSSKLETFEGSDVIIPNGDLISKHVINWTRNNTQRRVEILLGVKYGSDLKKCKDIIEKIINENEFIDKTPTSLVLFNQFKSSSIDFRILFWASLFKWMELKSDIIFIIQQEFKKEGIEITY